MTVPEIKAAVPTKSVRLAILECDTPLPAVVQKYGMYTSMYKSWLENSLLFNFKDVAVTSWTVEGFNVVDGEYPKPEDMEGERAFDGIILTGSCK